MRDVGRAISGEDWVERAGRAAAGVRRRVLAHTVRRGEGYLCQACSAAELLATLLFASGVAVVAAVVTPSQDPISLFAMAIPMWVFYFAAAAVARFVIEPARQRRQCDHRWDRCSASDRLNRCWPDQPPDVACLIDQLTIASALAVSGRCPWSLTLRSGWGSVGPYPATCWAPADPWRS